MRNYKRMVIWFITDTLLLSLLITLLFSNNVHRALNIKKNNGGYQKSIELSQNLLAYSMFNENVEDSLSGEFQLNKGTVVYLENASPKVLVGYYIDEVGNKCDAYIDASDTILLSEFQQYMTELNEANSNRMGYYLNNSIAQDYPVFLLFAIFTSLIIIITAKDSNKRHVICLIAVVILLVSFSIIVSRISIPI